MSKIKGAIVVNNDRCKGCQLCIVACPKDVIAIAQKKVNVHGYPYVEPANAEACIGCVACATVCPDGCITVYRKKWRREKYGRKRNNINERKRSHSSCSYSLWC